MRVRSKMSAYVHEGVWGWGGDIQDTHARMQCTHAQLPSSCAFCTLLPLSLPVAPHRQSHTHMCAETHANSPKQKNHHHTPLHACGVCIRV
jgi:hypothetical protein